MTQELEKIIKKLERDLRITSNKLSRSEEEREKLEEMRDKAEVLYQHVIWDLDKQKSLLNERNRELSFTQFSVDKAAEAIFWLDPETGKFEYANDVALASTGYSIEEFLNMSVPDLDPNFPSEQWAGFSAMLREQKMLHSESLHRRKDNSVFPVDLALKFMSYQDKEYFVAYVKDISERKENEKTIQDANEELKLLNDNLVGSNHELQKTLDELQKTQSQLVQSEKMAALGQLISNIAHEINTPMGAIKSSNEAIGHDARKLIEVAPQVFRKIDDSLLLLMTDLIIKASQKSSLTSKEERKARRALTKQLDKLDIPNSDDIADNLVDMGVLDNVENYLPMIKHDMGQGILDTAIRLTGLLNSSGTISTAIDRVRKIIFALKSYARFDDGMEKSKGKLSDGIEVVLTLYYNQMKHGIELSKSIDFDEPILCYHDELNQVWTNIMHNALQAMEYKGNIDIRTFREGNNAVVTIKDSGPGIPEDIQSKIFDAFFTTKPQGEGSGLGLDIVKKIIDKHKGTIRFETESGKGTTFIVTLPINTGE